MHRRKCVQVNVVVLVFLVSFGLSTAKLAPPCETQTITKSQLRLADTGPTPTPGTNGAGGGGHFGG